MDKSPLVACRNLKKYYTIKNHIIPEKRVLLRAVDDINLDIYKNETVGLVGESGCGKSSFGRTILGLHRPTSGQVFFNDISIGNLTFGNIRPLRKEMQMVFQDPFASLNPRMTIYEAIKAPLDVYNIGTAAEKREKVEQMLDYVGLSKKHMNKYPHEMSGGQRQRVVIARAVILNPSFIVLDEPVSALDVSVRSQVLNLMKDMQQENNLSYLFISHDLSVVNYICDRICVMYLGKILEIASKKELFSEPAHPYTKALLSAILLPDVTKKTKRIILQGDVPNPINPPSGCRFSTRCPYATEICHTQEPKLKNITDNHKAACFNLDKMN